MNSDKNTLSNINQNNNMRKLKMQQMLSKKIYLKHKIGNQKSFYQEMKIVILFSKIIEHNRKIRMKTT